MPPVQPSGLLIEPVWNRNGVQQRRVDRDSQLLIEPVWNRNFTLSK